MVLKEEKPVLVTLIGDAMIGKSTLVQAFMSQHLPQTSYVATVIDTYEGCLDVDGQKHNLSILDNAGQHDYGNMRSCSYKDSEVLVLCYSVADRNSLESIQDFWVPEVNNCTRRRKPIILVATQTDLRKDIDTDKVTTAEGERIAKQIGADCFLECSAFQQETVNHVFEVLTTSGLKYRKKRNNFMKKMFGK
ncbi:RHOJ-like protein [Mya arenaria]|uniref:RHOJ-like protein n=1 Tax=Mya arenaria TaxID=6604 RepID=A0ABY7FLA5_MYAAR|nr:rho-related GTP-binding protein RhoJ-like [Mya arenaria]WAR22830.1 RHOJ-like protein [Mya arenaria]